MIENVKILSKGHIVLSAYHCTPEGDHNVGLNEILVIMVHGFPGSQIGNLNLFTNIENTLSPMGFHTLRFDFRGCGESDGELEEFTLTSACEDFKSVLGWAKEQGYKRFIYVGEGIGAALSLLNLADEMACMVFLWPMIDLEYMANSVFGADQLDEHAIESGYMAYKNQRISIQLLQELTHTKLLKIMEKNRTPLLVLHGAADKISPIEQLDVLRTHSNARRVEITSFQNGENGLPDPTHRKMALYHLSQFIQKYA
jgi:pimeloyl-ACP methyl ester carboxylesterase